MQRARLLMPSPFQSCALDAARSAIDAVAHIRCTLGAARPAIDAVAHIRCTLDAARSAWARNKKWQRHLAQRWPSRPAQRPRGRHRWHRRRPRAPHLANPGTHPGQPQRASQNQHCPYTRPCLSPAAIRSANATSEIRKLGV